MSAPTPGPWKAVKHTDTKGWTVARNEGLGRSSIANVRPRAEAEANARLIAIAPDLFEAARDVLGFFNPGQCDCEGAQNPCALCRIRAAIARAEGGREAAEPPSASRRRRE